MLEKHFRRRAFLKHIKELTGFRPGKPDLYTLALIPPSSADNPGEAELNNERLEYLGDAVLESIISEFLYRKYPSKNEGYLTTARSQLVNRPILNRTGEILGLKEYIKSPAGHNQHSKNYLGNSLEALIGAIYLDKGFKQAKDFVCKKIIRPYSEENLKDPGLTDYKSKIIEWGQKNKREINFHTSAKEKESEMVFYTVLSLDGTEIGRGTGKTKKKAEQRASREAFEKNGDHIDEKED